VNWLFRRHFWIVHAMFLCIVAIVSAKTFTTLAGYWVSKHIPEKPSAKVFEEPEPEPMPKNFSLASERNLFNARREQISFTDEEDQETDPGRWQDAQLSSLPLKLVSTMVFNDPFDSRAVIQSVGSGIGQVYSVGECGSYRKNYDEMRIETVLPGRDWQPDRPCNSIEGIATLKRIEEFRVYIFNERDRRWEYLSLLADDRRMMRQRAVEEFAPVEGEGVRKVGATSYEIDQNEFDKALSNVARLMTEARAVPEMDGAGNYIGFKIIYVKEGSLFEKIGIERMDVLTRINGYELNSPEKALQLFGKLRTASQFTIDLKRGDRSVTLDYSVVR
jgi:general secretion pathway protein C